MTVYLVGAGPGDPGLLTVRAAEVLGRADVVVHDRLAEPSLLDLAPAQAQRVDVGKVPGGPVRQGEINALLIAHGRSGREVVRLKGGDPFVFGRGGEEALALRAAGVAYEVVPGVTSAIAVPAYAGVPVTHRGRATSFTVVTGHSRHATDRETNWEALAAAGGTIVVLMAVAHRDHIARRLIGGGLDPSTPVLAVHWGTRPEQRSVRTTLERLGQTPLEPPVTLVIGAVAGLELSWYERRPLFGRRIVVTRARAQASPLTARLRELGARPVEVPTIRIDEPGDGGAGLARAASSVAAGRYDWVAFTSANAVDPLLSRLRDARALGPARLAAVGPGTAEALGAWRLVPELLPERSIAEGLLDALRREAAGRALLPQAAGARPVLADGLRRAGWDVEVVEAYRTVPAEVSAHDAAAAADADAICFTSSSTVTGFLGAAGSAAVPPVVVCIGPQTAATARDAGLRVTTVARVHTLEGLLDALCATLAPAVPA